MSGEFDPKVEDDDCTGCEGSGSCDDCAGAGVDDKDRDCNKCEGTGDCPECQGTGSVN